MPALSAVGCLICPRRACVLPSDPQPPATRPLLFRLRSSSFPSPRSLSLAFRALANVYDMLGDDEDVFDSVTWESPAAPLTYEGTSAARTGPGFRQSTSESEDGRGPHDPKWEGYLITSVKDPVKELAETKDAYVSYLVSAKVSPALCCILQQWLTTAADEPSYILHT